MKRMWILGLLLVFVIGTVGCQNPGQVSTNTQTSVVKYEQDIRTFAKIGTTLAVQKAHLSKDELANIRGYLCAAEGLIATPEPNYAGARALINEKLPEKQRLVAMVVIDLVERYVPTPKIPEQVAQYQVLASAAMDAAVQAIDEYSPQ